jgi:hypothetical protein
MAVSLGVLAQGLVDSGVTKYTCPLIESNMAIPVRHHQPSLQRGVVCYIDLIWL